MAQPILSVSHLTVVRGTYTAVEDVCFQLFSGANVAIVGPNGAGKSTLIQAILGLIPYQSGEVEILGRRINQLGKYQQSIGYLPQRFTFERSFPLTVAELVSLALPRQLFFQGRQRQIAVQTALVNANLEHQAKQPIGTLSGGELKRVLLAYCLVIPRQLLILDEAMSEVDIAGEAEFSKLLIQLQKEQRFAILQISHDLDMVSRYCDHVLCLNRRIICQGEPGTILSDQNLSRVYGATSTRYFHHHLGMNNYLEL
ncbi:MAG: metal ABC transporter ATP-binding protein [Microcoleaceae cyanobacterium]